MFGIINCRPQQQDGPNNVTLKAQSTQTADQFQKILTNIKIKLLDVKKINIELQESIWSEQLVEILANFLKQLTNLEDININLSQSNITNSFLQKIIESLAELKNVTRFVIHIHICPELNSGYLQIIFQYLQQTKSHHFVQIHNGVNQGSDRDFKILSDYLMSNPKIQELNFQSFENSYGEEAHSYLCKGLNKNTNLQRLTLQTITEPPKFWENLANSLTNNSNLERIFIRFLGGGNEQKLAKGLLNISSTISSTNFIINSGQKYTQAFQEIQVIKKKCQLELSVFEKQIKPYLQNNPHQIAVDLFYN